MIQLFGFTIHDAPGEGEAECALLQRHGIVDAVLSEDVDTIMFGCTKLLRNWSSEGKGTNSPTHVSLYDSVKLDLSKIGLDREGLVLVALMSGGDYAPEGIPGCGPKVACEAAKAGFGKSLCRLKASDTKGISAWRKSLLHELRTNESGYFRTRHMKTTIPADFPNMEVLRYYTHPVVSPEATLENIRVKSERDQKIHIEALREFTREVFDWDYRIGAIKFIRVMGEAMLVDSLLRQGNDTGEYVKEVRGYREHFKADGTPELRLSYIPLQVVPIDLSNESDEPLTRARSGLALNSDDDFEGADGERERTESERAAAIRNYNRCLEDQVWILDVVARKGMPEMVEKWELKGKAKEMAKQNAEQAKAASKRRATGTQSKATKGMPAGSMHQYVRVRKGRADAAKAVDLDAAGHEWSDPPRSRANMARRLRPPSPLEPSKQPTTSSTSDSLVGTRTLASSHMTPRTRQHLDDQQAIFISSSPPSPVALPPVSPSPRPRVRPGARDVSHPVRQVVPPAAIEEGVRGPPWKTRNTKNTRATGKTVNISVETQPVKLKQTSLDVFARKSTKPISSQPPLSKPPPDRKEKASSQFLHDDLDSDSSSDLAPLSSFITRSPASLNKRHLTSTTPTRETSPRLAPARKKKLLVPRVSAVGFFKEIEVDADERDERVARETMLLKRRGVRGTVVRMSDVSFIDLTQED